jgi:hypothetical protein
VVDVYDREGELFMGKTDGHRHTMRFYVYRVAGALAVAAGIGVLVQVGIVWQTLAIAAVAGGLGVVLFLSAGYAERSERRTHFAYSTFFSRPRRAAIKILLAIEAVFLAFIILGESLLVYGWMPALAIVVLAIAGQALSDWWQVRRNIHVAVASGRIAAVEKLLVSDPERVHQRGGYGRTPLHLACALGQESIAKVLVFEGADVNSRAEGGWTALHWAAMMGRKELARRLIEEGADVNAEAEDGTRPLTWALRNHHEDTAEILRWHGAEE